MALARAFTTMRNKPDMTITAPMYIGRAASQRAGRPVTRSQISSPVALISTSNSLINNAEDISGTTPIEIRSVSNSSAPSSCGEESDGSSNASLYSRSNTETDASSVDDSPLAPEHNHLSCYFKPNVDTQRSKTSPALSPPSSERPSLETPALPQRAPSHSKKAHENLHRKRSVQRMLSPSRDCSIPCDLAGGSSQAVFVEAPKESPFGSELAQLDEVAEEFGNVVRNAEAESDLKVIKTYNLAQYAASDYMTEIQALVYATFVDDSPTLNWVGWI